MFTLCGIEITEEHAQQIKNTIARINQEEQDRKDRAFVQRLSETLKNNPHAPKPPLTVSEYIRTYLPESYNRLKQYF